MESLTTDDKIALPEVVSILGVCTATVKNWIRHQYLTADRIGGKLFFERHQVNSLKEKIASGEIDRLNRRANKKESRTTFIPGEYAEREDVSLTVGRVTALLTAGDLDSKSAMLAVLLWVLEDSQQIRAAKSLTPGAL